MKNNVKKALQAILLVLLVSCGGFILHSFASGHPPETGRSSDGRGTLVGAAPAPDGPPNAGVLGAARMRLDIARQEVAALSTASSGSPEDRAEAQQTANRLEQLSCYVLRHDRPTLKPSDQAELTRIGGLIHQMAVSARRPKPCMDAARVSLALVD